MAISKNDALRQLAQRFPQLTANNFKVTSPPDARYNCIAWAMEDNTRWWWPIGKYWPTGIPQSASIVAFQMMLEASGFIPTGSGAAEEGFAKLAIYADQHQRVTHAARQLDADWWTSKLGPYIDISHTLTAIEGPEYGAVVSIFKRPAAKSGA